VGSPAAEPTRFWGWEEEEDDGRGGGGEEEMARAWPLVME
jgi:hypothetical protein